MRVLGADADRRGRCLRAAPGPARAFRRSDGGPHGCDRARHVEKLAFTAVLAASFVLLYRTARFRRVTDGLRFYGRMSLTNYIAQSVVGALIFFPFGLGLASRCGYALSLVIGVAVFVLQAAFCRWWLRGHRQGPLESLWHRLTWLGAK